MSTDEIALATQVRQEQNKEQAKMLAWAVYNGATLIAVAVNDPKKFPKIEDAFPNLFEKKGQQDWRIMKERMEEFANVRNAVQH